MFRNICAAKLLPSVKLMFLRQSNEAKFLLKCYHFSLRANFVSRFYQFKKWNNFQFTSSVTVLRQPHFSLKALFYFLKCNFSQYFSVNTERRKLFLSQSSDVHVSHCYLNKFDFLCFQSKQKRIWIFFALNYRTLFTGNTGQSVHTERILYWQSHLALKKNTFYRNITTISTNHKHGFLIKAGEMFTY